ncbi:MAG: ribonuclease R [Algoriphagus sp.]|jgi:ribonuclease R|uniref:ribonuclease R n=6 Tax=Algoriphagus TaxID=246875 RepID=UPI000C4DC57F|nr:MULTISPECIES: ribonuclease R [unclassified Algoriphagus]MAL13150.1 ribonuclease R [Algoriphagus sp.]QYH41089.1 ribonuclease R [Algoriphagus sp. NBT04N3]|tara:strand:- start:18782 stop:20983 length:2202 start_codon:yes stop_codon:yes gene_type:complete
MGRKSNRKSSNKQNGGKKTDAASLARRILQFLDANYGQEFNAKQIIKKLDIRDSLTKGGVEPVLHKLVENGSVSKSPRNYFSSTQDPDFIEGTVDFVNPRFAFVIPDNPEKVDGDILVKEADLKQALDGDKVRVMVYPLKGKTGRTEGKVLEILERDRDEFVGRVEISPRFAFVVPDFKKMHKDIFVHRGDLMGAEHNEKVIVKMTEWREGDKNPTGKVIRVLGKAGVHEVEIHSIMAEFGLPFEYPQEADQEANAIPEKITSKEIKARRDFRDVTTFTIDPADAKDFDDAISYRKLENGNLEVGVHIADVTHYVKPKTALEKEAYDRATSVYLVDRTIPMLPERLSNGLCSLRPHEDKLTFACVFEMDSNANVLNHWIGRTIIHSDRRFAYEEAQENIDNQSGDFFQELTLLNDLAKQVRKRRFQHGAVNFETVEVKFKLDEKGTPLGLMIKERKDIHKMIEEFMLLANKYVAEFIFKKRSGADTFVYRTHDSPDMEKLEIFSGFAKRFGHQMDLDNEKKISSALNKLMDEIQGKPEQNVLEQLAIRSMAKAKYTTEPKGHFGLAFPHYTHFTSPIRRYPDMMVHRLLEHYLDGGKSPDAEAWEQKCVHSSEREKRAADAERASIKYKQVEYMALAEEKDYDGIVSGVTEWGVFVEITETKCEGMIRVQDMDDDYYDFDQKNMRLIGSRTKKMITLGDKVKVRVVNTDIDRRTIDLEFANNDERKPRARAFR